MWCSQRIQVRQSREIHVPTADDALDSAAPGERWAAVQVAIAAERPSRETAKLGTP